jgi:hypothetical protein
MYTIQSDPGCGYGGGLANFGEEEKRRWACLFIRPTTRRGGEREGTEEAKGMVERTVLVVR